jgi:hypothetical protein
MTGRSTWPTHKPGEVVDPRAVHPAVVRCRQRAQVGQRAGGGVKMAGRMFGCCPESMSNCPLSLMSIEKTPALYGAGSTPTRVRRYPSASKTAAFAAGARPTAKAKAQQIE